MRFCSFLFHGLDKLGQLESLPFHLGASQALEGDAVVSGVHEVVDLVLLPAVVLWRKGEGEAAVIEDVSSSVVGEGVAEG